MKSKVSKFLSLVLRHQPEVIGIELDQAGFVDVDDLLGAIAAHPTARNISLEELKNVVDTNDKQRFEFNESATKIRARQGHSVSVEHGLTPVEPPAYLLHGTATRVLDKIREGGLKKMNRHHVHMHCDDQVAVDVGGRHGRPVLLKIESSRMHDAGFEFFVTANNVWLTDHVPPEFIQFPE